MVVNDFKSLTFFSIRVHVFLCVQNVYLFLLSPKIARTDKHRARRDTNIFQFYANNSFYSFE